MPAETGSIAQPDSIATDAVASEALSIKVPHSLIDAYETITKKLEQFATEESVAQKFAIEPGESPARLNLVYGASIGLATSDSAPPGTPLLRIYAAENLPSTSVAEYVGAAFGVNALSDGTIGFEVVPTGPIDLQHRGFLSPAPGGISCGHISITAGTLGALVQDVGPANSLPLILSNNHVLANVNAGSQGDFILQPGPADGGQASNPNHVIGALDRYVQISFAQPNYVDCAVARVSAANSVRPDMMYMRQGQLAFFRCGTQPVPAVVGQTVGKSGRTTGLTVGRIVAVGATIQVNMGGGRVAVFRNQIEVVGLQGFFSQPGDSGSLVWTWSPTRDPVGLLFAGGGGSTFANPIGSVLSALNVALI